MVGICDADSNAFDSLVEEILKLPRACDGLGRREHRKDPTSQNVSPTHATNCHCQGIWVNKLLF